VARVPYPKNLLNDYETVALDLHPHWWHFAEPALTLAITIIVGIVVLALDGPDWLNLVVVAAILVGAVWLVARFVQWRTTNFVITSDRVIFRHGVFAKSGIEIPLERVNSVHFNQGIFERLIGAGDLLIESGAEGGQQRFTDIKNPDRVQLLIHQQMEVNEDRMYKGQARAGGDDLGAALERLEGLRDRGTLTDEEFEVQKRRLLGG
jgi:uncharacterized membrane protein YdbT with pleckstrin-like domain